MRTGCLTASASFTVELRFYQERPIAWISAYWTWTPSKSPPFLVLRICMLHVVPQMTNTWPHYRQTTRNLCSMTSKRKSGQTGSPALASYLRPFGRQSQIYARFDGNRTVDPSIRHQWLRDFPKTLDRSGIRSTLVRLPIKSSGACVLGCRALADPIVSLQPYQFARDT